MTHPRSTEDYQIRLKALENVYHRSKARVNGADEEWNTRRQILESKVWREIKSFNPEDQPSKAVLIIGRLQAIAAELDQPRLNVLEYEELHKRYIQRAEADDKKPDITL